MSGSIQGVGVLRYPAYEGTRDIARSLSENICSGIILVMPNTRDSYGGFEWDFRIEGGDFDQVVIERSDVDKPFIIEKE